MSGLRMVMREDSASPGGCCALCSSAVLRAAATPKMLDAARLRTQSRETWRVESVFILAAPRRQVAARPQLILALRLYLAHRRQYSSTVLVSGSQMQEAEAKMREFKRSLSQNWSSWLCGGNLSLTNRESDWIIDRTDSFRRTFTSVQRT